MCPGTWKKHRNGEFSNVKIFVVPLVLVFCKNCRYAALMVDTDDQSWLRALQLLEDSERRGVDANDVMFGKACMRPLAAYGETQEDVRTMGWCVHGFTLHLQLQKRELKIVDAKMVLCRPSTVVQLLHSVKLRLQDVSEEQRRFKELVCCRAFWMLEVGDCLMPVTGLGMWD